jgi:predicted pyridoxine 5'-phosphate oxidase superfamily flavin-nucleotide-binding protein
MGILTDDMKRVVREQRLGFIATVCPDGTPNLSPKATTTVWDDDHLIFGDINSPNTVENLSHNPVLEINVVDNALRKGYRFKGTAQILRDGPLHDQILASYVRKKISNPMKAVVLIKVEQAAPLISPGYDGGRSEEDIHAEWESYWSNLWHDWNASRQPQPAGSRNGA